MSQISFALTEFMEYWGNGQYLILFLAALIFLVFQKKEMWQNHYLGKVILLIMICSCNPIGVSVIKRCIGDIVFWRVFWTLPSSLIIAYAVIQVLFNKEEACNDNNESINEDESINEYESVNGTMNKKEWWKGHIRNSYQTVGFLFAILVLALCGNYMYHSGDFQKAPNKWQIPAEAVNVCDIITADAALDGVAVKMTAPPEISNYARQYDASISLLAGRNTNTYSARRVRTIYGGVLTKKTVKRLIRTSKKKECNYLVCYKDPVFEEIVEKKGYKIISETDDFIICKREIKEK